MLDQFIIFCAQYLYLVIAGIGFFFLLFSERSIKKGVLAVGTVSTVLALVAVVSNGFPSEHVLFAIVIAGTIFIFNKKLGGFLAVLGLVVGYGRVFANVHHPVDILGALIIGITSVGVGWLIFYWISNRKYLSF